MLLEEDTTVYRVVNTIAILVRPPDGKKREWTETTTVVKVSYAGDV